MSIRQQYASAAVLDVDFRNGTPKDNSPSDHTPTLALAKWVNTGKGRALDRTTGTSLTYPDSGDFDLAGKETTLVLDIMPYTGYAPTTTVAIVDHFTGGGSTAGWLWHMTSAGKFGFFTVKTGPSQITASSDNALNDGKKHQLVVTISDSAKTGLLYVDGIEQAASLDWTGVELLDYAQTLQFHSDEKTPILRPSIYANTILTAQEVAQLWEETQKEAFLTHIPTSTRLPEQTGDVDPSNLALHYTGRIQENKLLDISGGGNNTSALAKTFNTNGFYGQKLSFQEYPTCQTANNLDLSSYDQVSVSFLYTPSSVATTQQIIELSSNQNAQIDSWSVFTAASKLSCALTTSGGGTDRNGPTLVNGVTYSVVVVFDKTVSGNDMVEIYVNGVESSTAGGAANGTSGGNFGNRKLYIGARGGVSALNLSAIEDIRIYGTKLTQGYITKLYEQGKDKLNYYATGEDWNVSVANETAGFLSNTGWAIGSGTWQASDNNDGARGKQHTCVVAGKLAYPSEQAYGQWEFDIYQGGATAPVPYFMGLSATAASGAWSMYISAAGEIKLFNTTDFNIAETAAGYVSQATWYRFKVTRTTANVWTMYYSTDGGKNYTLVDVTGGSGTNPITNTRFTTSKYTTLDLDALDCTRNFRYSPVIT